MHVPLRDTDGSDHPESPAITRDLHRRLERLEAIAEPPLRMRVVWLEKGDPVPEAEPGEQLLLVRWIWDDDEPAPEKSVR